VAVEVENTNATLKNGILRVTLPKAASSRPQKIAIHA
jgi:HSP20 family molecular chaperone IbpA